MGIVATRKHQELLAAVEELAEYLDESPLATAVNVGNSFYLVAEEWEKNPPKTPEEIRQYYRQSKAYLWNLVLSNYAIPTQIEVRRVAASLATPGCLVLDVGAGIGSTLLALPATCHKTHVDVGGEMMTYAAWRYARREERVEVIETPAVLGEDALSNRAFDVLVCTEVIEHVPDPVAMVAFLARHARPGARLVATVSFDDDDHGLFPCHLNLDKFDNESFLAEVFPHHGFRRDGEFVFTKV